MKVHISFDEPERKEAGAVLAALLRKYPGARVHDAVCKDGKYHLYLTTRKPKNPKSRNGFP